jgi:hypothetical protein
VYVVAAEVSTGDEFKAGRAVVNGRLVVI